MKHAIAATGWIIRTPILNIVIYSPKCSAIPNPYSYSSTLHLQEVDSGWLPKRLHGSVSQLHPVQVDTVCISTASTSHERDQLLSVASRVELNELSVSCLHLLAADGGEETDPFGVNGCLLRGYHLGVDGVEALDTLDELIGNSYVVTVSCVRETKVVR